MQFRRIPGRACAAPSTPVPVWRAVLLAALVASNPALALSTIEGRVATADGAPLADARVQLLGGRTSVSTDENGRFRLTGLPDGQATLIVDRADYNPVSRPVNLTADGVLEVALTLEPAVVALERLVVSGVPLQADPFDVAGSIDVLAGREKLRRETASLGGSLDALAGVSNLSTGSQNGKPIIRGLWGNRIRVLKDGIGVNHQQFSFRHAPNIEPLLADRIEVVRGPSSVLYGSDAIGGAVNVLSRTTPTAAPGGSVLDGIVTAHYAGVNDERTLLGRLDGAAGGFGFTAAVLDRSAGNLEVPNEPTWPATRINGQPNFTGELDHTDFDQLNSEFTLGYSFDRGRVSLRYEGWDTEQNFLLPPPVNLPNGTGIGINLENDTLAALAEFQLSPRWTLYGQLADIDNLRQANPPGVTREFIPDSVVIDVLRESRTARFEARHLELGPGFAGRIGVEWLNEDQFSRGAVGLTPGGEIDNFAVFAFEGLQLGSWGLEFGLRYDQREQEALLERTFDDNIVPDDPALRRQEYDVFTASFGVNYRLSDSLALVANVAQGFRAPTLFELHANGVHGGVAAFQRGNPNLDEETSLGFDLGVRWRNERIELAANVYRIEIDDYIYFADTGESTEDGLPILRSGQDGGTLTGFDLTMTAALADRLRLRGTLESVDGEFNDVDESLPLLPADQLQLEAIYDLGRQGPLQASYFLLGIRYAADQQAAPPREPFSQFDVIPFGTASTDDYTLIDVGFGFELPTNQGFRMIVDVGVSNLLNEAYRDFLDTYKAYALSPGRNVWLRTTIPFGIVNQQGG